MRYTSAAATLVVAALFASPCAAQEPAAPTDTMRRVSAKHSITVHPVWRRYSVDTATVVEWATGLEYAFNSGRTRLRLTGMALDYSDGQATIRGAAAPELVADIHTGRRDSVRLTIRGPSLPPVLSSGHVAALATSGTATLDLESASLGSAAGVGVRTAFGGPAGPLVVGFRLGLEVEPRPGGSDFVYWRGSTIHAGAGVTAFTGELRITAGFDYANSGGDSLGGRNLFPGGGSYTVRLDAAGLVGSGATLATGSAFYFRPFGANSSSQPNRRLPSADFAGVRATLLIPVGTLFVSPALSAVRESTHDIPLSGVFAGGRSTFDGVGWSVSGSAAVDIPIGRVSLTPEAGYVRGSLNSEITVLGLPGSVRLGPFSDRVSGWWTALELTATF